MIIWLIIILLEAYRNWHIIEVQKSRPNYLQSFILRGIVAIFHGIYMGVTEPANWYPVLIFQVSSFWILFDVTLNILRGKSIFYLGDPKKGSSGWLDRLPISIYWILKLIVLLTLIWSL
jgi:hypothetical protein